MPGRPKKLKRKEATGSRKTGKLSRCGGQVTCTLCKAKGHNKRGFPHAASSTTVDAASDVTAASIPHAGRGRGRGRGSAPPAAATSSSCGSTSISERSRGRGSAPLSGSSSMPYAGSTGASGKGRARGRGIEMDARGRGRERGTGGFESSSGLEGWFNFSQGSANNAPEKGRNPTGSGPFKRMVVVGLMVANSGYIAFNPGLPSQRVVNLGARTVTSSADVTRDIGYQPRTGVKWKEKATITSRRLQQMRGDKIIQTRAKQGSQRRQDDPIADFVLLFENMAGGTNAELRQRVQLEALIGQALEIGTEGKTKQRNRRKVGKSKLPKMKGMPRMGGRRRLPMARKQAAISKASLLVVDWHLKKDCPVQTRVNTMLAEKKQEKVAEANAIVADVNEATWALHVNNPVGLINRVGSMRTLISKGTGGLLGA
ncbi:hypothetical protein A4A49_20458 [Nicotiana attenuata]|uniref:Uncharacterized protein n=1 Tax=Nicotiana attenuata TaxID=49451 RepID=A0A1J6IP99_NICAT|nr:hypothetical protein A4A49_20458 [Nicotiana attenuata]